MKNWLKCRKTVTFEKELSSPKRQPFKKIRVVNKILVMNSILDLTVITWLNSVLCKSLVSDSEIFRGLFSYLTHFLILIHSAQSQINTTQRLISRFFSDLESFITFETQTRAPLHRPSATKQWKSFNVNKKWRVSIGAFSYNFTQPFTTTLCS